MTLPPYVKPSGDVSRWHAHPCDALRLSGDTINKHQKRCAHWVLQLWPDAPDTLVQAAEHHDEPERWLGDMPHPAKRDNPGIAVEYRRAEDAIVAAYNIPQPATHWEAYEVKLVDMLDAYWWMQRCAPHLASDPEWVQARKDIELSAHVCRAVDAVAVIIGPP